MSYSYLKKGTAAATAFDQEAKAAERRKTQQQNKVYSFWLRKDSSAYVTFLDGDVDSEGTLLADASYREHSAYVNGRWERFVCTKEAEGQCPLCEERNYPSTIAAFTVIDHTEFTSKKGETYTHQTRLFPTKRGTFEKLQKLAAKRGGLTGCTFEITRSASDKSPAVGDMFDFESKRSLEEVLKEYKVEGPVNYEQAIQYVPYAELCQLLGVKATIQQKVDTTTSERVIGTESGVEDEQETDLPF